MSKDRWAIVGKDINYSYSPAIYEYLAKKHQIDLEYKIENLNSLTDLKVNEFDFLNFTIPYKQEILQKDFMKTEEVIKYRSSNLLISKKGELFTTDQIGIKYVIEKIFKLNLTEIKAVILGSGAMGQMISKLIPQSIICSRTPQEGEISYSELRKIKGDIIINTTPVGVGKLKDASPVEKEILKNYDYLFDLTYNPYNTKLIIEAKLQGLQTENGLIMLIVQALENFEIAYKIAYSTKDVKELKEYLIAEKIKKSVIIGMPLAGKSTYFNKSTVKNKVDIDTEIESKENLKIEELINSGQIEKFRKLESKYIAKAVKNEEELIVPGAGFILDEANLLMLKDYVFGYLKTELSIIYERRKKESRPLLKNDEQLAKLFSERIQKYENLADVKINNESEIK